MCRSEVPLLARPLPQPDRGAGPRVAGRHAPPPAPRPRTQLPPGRVGGVAAAPAQPRDAPRHGQRHQPRGGGQPRHPRQPHRDQPRG